MNDNKRLFGEFAGWTCNGRVLMDEAGNRYTPIAVKVSHWEKQRLKPRRLMYDRPGWDD